MHWSEQLGITNAVAHAVPKPYVVFGLAGGIPYIGASGTTIYLAYQAGLAAQGETVFSTGVEQSSESNVLQA